jgi:hypothetical protein
LIASGQHTKAYNVAYNYLAPSCKQRGLYVRYAVVLYLAALSSMEATKVNNDSTMAAMPAILSCHTTCQSLGLLTLENKTSILLANIQLQNGEAIAGLRQLDSALPNILAHCNSKVQGDAHLCRAKCLLSLASRCSSDGGKIKRLSKRTFIEVRDLLFFLSFRN